MSSGLRQHINPNASAVLSVRRLRKDFPLRRSWLDAALIRLQRQAIPVVQAVDDVSFEVYAGETLGIVGESGCGKTTLGRTILQLLEPTGGQILFQGTDLSRLSGQQLRSLRQSMQIIFQDPAASLNPRKTVEQTISRALKVAGVRTRSERQSRLRSLLGQVSLEPQVAQRYPHQLSGGQKQRVSIARALATEPDFIVADEPVSSLDVSVQAQILNLLIRLQRERGLSMLFISHDLSVVRQLSDRIAVMYLGKIVEIAPTEDIVRLPRHPYTQSLLEAVPRLHHGHLLTPELIAGEWIESLSPSSGCPFHPRCSAQQVDECREAVPALVEVDSGHSVACHIIRGSNEE